MKHTEVGGKVAASGDNRLKPSDFSSVVYFGAFMCFYMLTCGDIVSCQLSCSPESSITMAIQSFIPTF